MAENDSDFGVFLAGFIVGGLSRSGDRPADGPEIGCGNPYLYQRKEY